MSVTPPIRALIAHGSISDRAQLAAALRVDPEIAVVGEAMRAEEAVALTKQIRPQVLVLGTHLPAAGAVGATRQIMIEAPTPIIIVADDTDAAQVEITVAALGAGALAVIPKPWTSQRDANSNPRRFLSTIKALSQVKVIRHWRERQAPPIVLPDRASRSAMPARVVAVAASTGGPAALQQLLSDLPASFPAPILVVQHIAPGFIHSLAETLGAACPLEVRVATDGEPLSPRTVFVAPDGNHLGVSDRSRIVLSNTDLVGGFRPSATILFESVARAFGSRSAHVILTGMGRDGVAGLEVARRLGAKVLAQDEASSVVFGMPGETVRAGLAHSVGPLASIARELVAITRE